MWLGGVFLGQLCVPRANGLKGAYLGPVQGGVVASKKKTVCLDPKHRLAHLKRLFVKNTALGIQNPKVNGHKPLYQLGTPVFGDEIEKVLAQEALERVPPHLLLKPLGFLGALGEQG